MTDDEFLKLCRVAPKTQQMKVLLMTTTLVEYKRRRQNAPATADSVETQTVKPAPAPIVVNPTPVEEKPQRTPQYVPGMDLNVFRAQVNAVNGVKVAENDEDILRGKIKPDTDF